eukprot:748090-Hanusia_phi.AAC.1
MATLLLMAAVLMNAEGSRGQDVQAAAPTSQATVQIDQQKTDYHTVCDLPPGFRHTCLLCFAERVEGWDSEDRDELDSEREFCWNLKEYPELNVSMSRLATCGLSSRWEADSR